MDGWTYSSWGSGWVREWSEWVGGEVSGWMGCVGWWWSEWIGGVHGVSGWCSGVGGCKCKNIFIYNITSKQRLPVYFTNLHITWFN